MCAEAYNPDEEDDDAESRVFNALSQILIFYQFLDIKFRQTNVTSLTIPFQKHLL